MRYYDWFSDGTVIVATLGLACCVVETEAAAIGRPEVTEIPADARLVLTIAGTVTDALAPLVARTIAAHPHADVISFGACASAGGPYWDSPVVTKGVDQIAPVSHYLPGCPPSPAALDALLHQEYRHG